mgnify:CR=1 FL=1
MAESIQESLYALMQSHQDNKLSDVDFTSRIKEIRSQKGWADEQNNFLNDYVSNLALDKQEFMKTEFTSKVTDNRSFGPNTSDYKMMDLNPEPITESETQPDKSVWKNRTWVKWALGVAGVALMLTPYKVVVHSF